MGEADAIRELHADLDAIDQAYDQLAVADPALRVQLFFSRERKETELRLIESVGTITLQLENNDLAKMYRLN